MQKEKIIRRVCHMERLFDEVSGALECGKDLAAFAGQIQELTAYMDSGQWQEDYAADELGALPAQLKRGVLSQDGLYDLLTELEEKRSRE